MIGPAIVTQRAARAPFGAWASKVRREELVQPVIVVFGQVDRLPLPGVIDHSELWVVVSDPADRHVCVQIDATRFLEEALHLRQSVEASRRAALDGAGRCQGRGQQHEQQAKGSPSHRSQLRSQLFSLREVTSRAPAACPAGAWAGASAGSVRESDVSQPRARDIRSRTLLQYMRSMFNVAVYT